jgi:acetylornithine/succinyldiaminopimelate/putrescine aminotransferase
MDVSACKEKFDEDGTVSMQDIDIVMHLREISLKLLPKALPLGRTYRHVIRSAPSIILRKDEGNDILVILKETLEDLSETQ